ncbi:MAG: RNA-directed DNA polymerase [Bacteroidetes bacterium]|nr:RNA-directed DNA polymerase [Bacteroidota bacterium]MDE2672959.1 RNA-directed DNA polymerase [Bacteroidota bacterium]
MAVKLLVPKLELLSKEYVLIQAWKKTASYIRRHNWFSDTLDLDRVALNLPNFIDQLRERLHSWEDWEPHPLRFIPAPKSQNWKIADDKWVPDGSEIKLRPLAHVSLPDQVAATALMLCLADRIETIQGDPSELIADQESRKRVISYGNRLFCYKEGVCLRHRWGSTKLYRKYFQDYRKFVSRPEFVVKQFLEEKNNKIYVVHADIKQFYDRVTPELLHAAISRVRCEGDDPRFFDLLFSVLKWGWDSRDEDNIKMYAEQAKLKNSSQIVLPQGLVASGFFANVVLLAVDEELRDAIGTQIAPNFLLVDICRYVDDLRVVVALDGQTEHSCDPEKVVSKGNYIGYLKYLR